MTIPAEIDAAIYDARRGHRIDEYEGAALRLAAAVERHFQASPNNALRALSQWIDDGNADRDPEAVTWGRLAKVGEECGEVIGAYIGATGQNPRKGVTHTEADVEEELLDVAVTALGAIAHLRHNDPGVDVLALLDDKIIRVATRAGVA